MNRPAQKFASNPVPERSGAIVENCWSAPISDEDFTYFRQVAYRQAGISIAEHKRNMVFRRVSKRMRALGLETLSDYRGFLEGPGRNLEMQNLVNVLTTNKTSFFRENHHFRFLRMTALPALRARCNSEKRRLRIWSAGCSSGEEPYSIAMTLGASFDDLLSWDARILATDIDTDMVEHGRLGVYANESLADLPVDLRGPYIEPRDAQSFSLTSDLKKLITFRHLNLLGAWPMKGPFDMIFCRNVVIYFDRETKQALVDRFADILAPDGLLFIGHSESLFKISGRFKMVGQSVYQRIG